MFWVCNLVCIFLLCWLIVLKIFLIILWIVDIDKLNRCEIFFIDVVLVKYYSVMRSCLFGRILVWGLWLFFCRIINILFKIVMYNFLFSLKCILKLLICWGLDINWIIFRIYFFILGILFFFIWINFIVFFVLYWNLYFNLVLLCKVLRNK